MHPVDRHELFSHGVRCAVMVGVRAGDAPQHVPLAAASKEVMQALSYEAPPVGAHAGLHGWMGQDGRCPFKRVDLGDEGSVHQPRRLEELLIVPLGVRRPEPVADRIVLEREERVHQAKPNPPVAVDAGNLDAGALIEGKQAVGQHVQLSLLTGAHELLGGEVAAVDLGGIPPVRHGVEERRWTVVAPPRWVASGALDEHGTSGSSSIRKGRCGSLGPWVNQSWTWNWIQAAARTLRVVAGMNVSRVISFRLISRGLGCRRPGSGSARARAGSTFRPKRVRALPMAGSARSLYVPSA